MTKDPDKVGLVKGVKGVIRHNARNLANQAVRHATGQAARERREDKKK